MMLYASCTPDCKDIPVSIADWQTRYEDYWVEFDSVILTTEMVDTTVSYSVEKYYTKMKYLANSDGKDTSATCTHYITIRNNNKMYSNQFAIKISWQEYNKTSKLWHKKSKTTNYFTISPNSTHTFQITHTDWWHNTIRGYSEDDITLKILQLSQLVEHTSKKIIHVKRKQTRRIDELVMNDTVVNNCDCDVDAIKAKNQAVSEIFGKLKEQKLIHTH